MTADASLLNQILNTLTTLGERLAVVEADLKTVIRDHTKDLDDHEARLRLLETAERDRVTQGDLDALEARRAEAALEAARVSDRKATIRVAIVGVVVSLVAFGVNLWFNITH